MRHLVKILMLILLYLSSIPSYASLEGKLDYHAPIDYTKISREELEAKAGVYYQLVLKTFQPATPNFSSQERGKSFVNEEMTAALNMYKILQSQNPADVTYNIRLGHLYDIAGLDRYAKGAFNAAIGCDNSQPEPYFRLGEFYYRRQMYKKALKLYIEAYKRGYDTNYNTLYKLGDIYAKLGDTEAALKYLNLAAEQSANDELNAKIQRLNIENQRNQEYYSNTRIRTIER